MLCEALACGFLSLSKKTRRSNHLAPVVQKVDSAIQQINHYPVDSAIGFPNIYPLDSDLSSGQRYPTFEQPGPADVKQRKHSLLSKIWAFEHSSLESNLTSIVWYPMKLTGQQCSSQIVGGTEGCQRFLKRFTSCYFGQFLFLTLLTTNS